MHLDPETHQMTAIVLAGDRTKADSLVNHSEAGAKAMIDGVADWPAMWWSTGCRL